MKTQSMYPHPAVRRQTHLITALWVLALFSLLLSPLSAGAYEPTERGDPLSVRFEGFIRAMGPTKWLVGQQSVFVSENTTIIEKIWRADVGAGVIVMAKPDSAGGLHATYIIVTTGSPHGGGDRPIPDQQISGRVESITTSFITVAGRIIGIGSVGTDMPVVPQVGDQVRVIAEPTDLIGGMWATSIEIIAGAGNSALAEFEGAIQTMQADMWIVDGRRVEITAGTKIYGVQAVIGKNAEVQALQTGGRLIAQAIRVTEPSAEITVYALVAAILNGGSPTEIWDLLVFYDELWGTPPTQMQIYVTGNTLVDERRAVAKASQWAEVRGLPLAPDKLQADTIHMDQPTPITITGLVQRTSTRSSQVAATGEWWQVGEWRVWIENGAAAAAATGTLAADSQVTIEGFLLGNGMVWAGPLPGTSSAGQ